MRLNPLEFRPLTIWNVNEIDNRLVGARQRNLKQTTMLLIKLEITDTNN